MNKNYANEILPPYWILDQEFSDRIHFGRLSLEVSGLAAKREDGVTVMGSAVATGFGARERASWELMERISIAEAQAAKDTRWSAVGLKRNPVGSFASVELFPPEQEGALIRYARSNGVALHSNREDACRRAWCELIERDRVLRSWYGQGRPCPGAPEMLFAVPPLNELVYRYEFSWYYFRQPNDPVAVEVVGVFAFPLNQNDPCICGFGADVELLGALDKAVNECVQRLAFLLDEPIDPAPAFEPSASYHQEIFLGPEGQRQLRDWLAGRHENAGFTLDQTKFPVEPPCGDPCFIDLTPSAYKGRVFVMKALERGRWPLIFGKAYLPEGSGFAEIHPIA